MEVPADIKKDLFAMNIITNILVVYWKEYSNNEPVKWKIRKNKILCLSPLTDFWTDETKRVREAIDDKAIISLINKFIRQETKIANE